MGSRKRRRRPKASVTVDSIHGALPDSIVQHILSFLPAIEAAKTTVLSKRWRSHWTQVPVLTFTLYTHQQQTNNKFAAFVRKTLTLRRRLSSKLEKLHISFIYNSKFRSEANKWIRLATECNVNQLSLEFINAHDFGQYRLPQFIYSSPSLRSLNTMMCAFAPRPSEYISWTTLKDLSIGGTELKNDTVQKILLGSPKLEYLKLMYCWADEKITVKSENLKELVIENLRESEVRREMFVEISIWCPNIRSLSLIGDMRENMLKFSNLLSLMEANLNFSYCYFRERYLNWLMETLPELCHVQKLTLGTWCLEAISKFQKQSMPSSLSKCKSLILDVDYRNWTNLQAIAILLKSLPHLEKSSINMLAPSTQKEFYKPSLTEIENYWQSMKGYFEHLKSLQIFGFRQISDVELNMFGSMVEFLLKNAIVLEKMVVYSQTDTLQGFKVSEYFLSYPRASPDAVVLFEPSLNT